MELQAIDGRLSGNYNIFHDYKLTSVVATDTRLMGVVAMRFEWRSNYRKAGRLFLLVHLDYSEYGIDEYEEIIHIPGDELYDDGITEMRDMWSYQTSSMGGRIHEIPVEAAVKLIEPAIEVYRSSALYRSGDDEHLKFRTYAEHRLNMMRDELIAQGSLDLDKYRNMSIADAYRYVIPKNLASNEVINYFIMRLIDKDFTVMPLLTDIPEVALRECELAKHGLQSLIKCNISSVPKSAQDYVCLAVTLGDNTDKYFYTKLHIVLNGGARDKNRIVNAINVDYFNKLSDYEAAMQTKRTEYITVYDVEDSLLNDFDISDSPLLAGVVPRVTDNGWIFAIYNQNNDHVNRSEFHLNDDVFGTALLTIPGELVLMTYKLVDINTFEASLLLSQAISRLHLKGRYQIDTPIFQTLCTTTGALFEEMIEQ